MKQSLTCLAKIMKILYNKFHNLEVTFFLYYEIPLFLILTFMIKDISVQLKNTDSQFKGGANEEHTGRT